MKNFIYKTIIIFCINIFLLNNTYSQDCNKIANDYIIFAKKAIVVYKKLKNSPPANISEYVEFENQLRDLQNKATDCGLKDTKIAMKIMPTMKELKKAIDNSIISRVR